MRCRITQISNNATAMAKPVNRKHASQYIKKQNPTNRDLSNV